MAGFSRYDLGKTGSFLPSLSYPGSSGTRTPMNFDTRDYPVMDSSTGQVISIKTGKKWQGAIPGASAQVQPNNPTDPNRFQAVDVVKSPGVASATNTLLDSFNQGAGATTKSFQDLFKEAKVAQDANKAAFQKEQQSFDVSGTANTLRQANQDFAATSRGIGDRYAATDADYESRQRALTQKALDVLPQYEDAARAVADKQYSQAAGAVSRYKAGSGTPMSLGGSELSLLNRAASDVYVPLKRDEIARRLGLITDMQMPLEREYANRDVARTTQFDYPNERYLSERTADTEKQIKQLELSVAGMSRQQATDYIRSLGLPMEIAQQILSRHIANLSGIAGLEDQSHYRGLEDTQGVNVSQPQYFNPGVPGYPVISQTRYPTPTLPTLPPTAGTGVSAPLNLDGLAAMRAAGNRYIGSRPIV